MGCGKLSAGRSVDDGEMFNRGKSYETTINDSWSDSADVEHRLC